MPISRPDPELTGSPVPDAATEPSTGVLKKHFVLKGETSLDGLADHLSASFNTVCRFIKRETLALYDTHVWTLWHEGLLLVQSRSRLTLQKRAGDWPDGEAVASLPLKGTCPHLARDFPPSELQRVLCKRLGYRALHKVGKLYTHHIEWDLRDSSQKVVVRLRISESPQPKVNLLFVEVVPLTGYDREAHAAGELLAAVSEPEAAGPLQGAFSSEEPDPVPYMLKPEFEFSPTAETRAVLCEVALKTLGIARFNERGTVQDWDTEFLHDLRISLRRIRSVLGSIKEVFPERELQEWKEVLGTISRHTNQVRDLDVYLLSRHEMTELLPAELQDGLDRFFDDLSHQRKTAFRKLRAYLKSAKYREKMQYLEQAFSNPGKLPEMKHGMAPIRQQAANRLAKRLRQLTRLAKELEVDAPDDAIHEIRIAGKKLRYLLEFFGKLFPDREVAALTRSLGKLQRQLGEFNDTSVQQAYLLKYAAAEARIQEPRIAMSLGGLIAVIARKHQSLKRKVGEKLDQLSSSADVENFRKMIARYQSR
ncbi:MAG TPA: CHAD domain-containing protein [Chthoniobacteraceae bacterium]|nr:CHAD domain-containing protein [Chthoniobacteraceae bacterium]